MENTPRTLKVGDRIYSMIFGGNVDPCNPLVVERVTKTMAMAAGRKFRLQLAISGKAYHIGWSPYSYYIETPEIAERHLRASVAQKARDFNYHISPIETIHQLNILLTPAPRPATITTPEG